MAIPNNLIAAALQVGGAGEALALKAGPLHIDLCRHQRYISIKDQLIRARTLTKWLIDVGVVDDKTQRVLIIGAGVAGVSAATSLLDASPNLTFKVGLIDSKHDAFAAQANAPTRILSLTQYDWPAAHAGEHSMPHSGWGYLGQGTSYPSHQIISATAPERAHTLAGNWRRNFYPILPGHRRLEFLRAHHMVREPVVASSTTLDVEIHDMANNRSQTQAYGLVISAVGFPQEDIPYFPGTKTLVTPYFWSRDSLADDPSPHARKPVAIVGLGDGAIQDFVRLTCEPKFITALSLVEGIQSEYVRLGGATVDWDDMVDQLASIDRQAALALPWAANASSVWDEADENCARAIHSLAAKNKMFIDAVGSCLRFDLPSVIHFFTPNSHPQKVYMLNRFLFHALRMSLAPPSRRLVIRGGQIILRPHVKLVVGDAVLARSSKPGAIQIVALASAGTYISTNQTYSHVIWRGGLLRDPTKRPMPNIANGLGTAGQPFAPPH